MTYGHEGYEGYEGYEDPDAYGPPQPAPESDASAGRGRRRRAAPEPESEQFEPRPEPEPAYADPQWEHSGLGWDRRAWDEAQRIQYAAGQYVDEGRGVGQYGGPRYDPEPQEYEADRYAPDQYAADQHGVQHGVPQGADRYPDEEYGRGEYEPVEFPEAEARYGESAFESEYRRESPPPPEAVAAPPSAVIDGPAAAPSAAPPDSASAAIAGRGAFGAAGLAVVTGVSALAAKPVLAVVVGLSQIGLAVGWFRTVGLPATRRTVTLVALIGLAACALAYRLVPDRAPAAMGAALGVGFVFLGADQLFRKETGAGRHRSEALAAAATGGAFAVLPAGYLVAQRADSALAGACALAAAVGVLCSALVGGGRHPLGIAAAVAAATAVGTLTAVSLTASAGAKGGAFGGLVSGLFAVVAARMTDRIGSEGSDVRISSQALPTAFSAIGAVIAAQLLR